MSVIHQAKNSKEGGYFKKIVVYVPGSTLGMDELNEVLMVSMIPLAITE
jgi:hypothetical protein